MSDPIQPPSESGGFNLDWQVASRYAHFAGGFWTGDAPPQNWWRAWWLRGPLLLVARVIQIAIGAVHGLLGHHGRSAQRAWALTLALAGSLMLSTYVTVLMNQWNRWFFDALERRDYGDTQVRFYRHGV